MVYSTPVYLGYLFSLAVHFMSERYFRIIVGLWLVTGLFLDSAIIVFSLLCLLLFEGLTNLRVPIIISRLRYGAEAAGSAVTEPASRFSFEAERALRLLVVIFVATPMLQNLSGLIPSADAMVANMPLDFLGLLWWLPWFVGFALIGAGLSGMCPMVIALRYFGLR